MKKITVPMPNTLYRMAWLLLILKNILSPSTIVLWNDMVDDIFSLLAVMFFALAIIQKHFHYKYLFVCVLLVVTAVYNATQIDSLAILMTVMCCISVRCDDLDDTIWFLYKWESAFVFVNMLCALVLGLAGQSMWMRISGKMCYTFGFSHPNVFSIILVNLSLMWCWIHYETLNFRKLATLMLLHLFFYCFTGCRTPLVIIVIFIVFYWFFHGKPRRRSVLRHMTRLIFPLLTIVVYLLIRFYTTGNSLISLIDDLLSWRIHLGAYALERFGLSFWGKNLQNVSVSWDAYWRMNGMTFDNLYSMTLVNYGIIWTVVLTAGFYLVAKQENERNNIFILLWCAYAMTEVHGVNPLMLFPLLILLAKPPRGTVGTGSGRLILKISENIPSGDNKIG